MKPLLAAVLMLAATTAQAQQDRVVARVFDAEARPVPFALVTLRDGVSRIADDSGRVTFNEAAQDSTRFIVRRIGYDPFFGYVKRSADGDFPIMLRVLPRSIQTLRVTERANTPLGRSGFYDRVQRVQAGAYSARMITPEELELRNPTKFTQMMQGENAVRVQRYDHRMMLTGRGGQCAMSILLDGMRVTGTLEELVENKVNPPPVSSLTSIDDLVNMNGVAAIEIYSSAASIPAELQRSLGGGSCGLIAIWTGRRR